jgi:hypothetical protein
MLESKTELDGRPADVSLEEARLRDVLPIGPQWYLVAYRWFLVAAGIYTIWSTWHVWQFREASQFPFSPMLPIWGGLPQFDFGWILVASLLSILVLPRTGMTVLSVLLVFSVLCDRMRLQPHYQIVLLLWATLPGVNAQFFGRMSLITLWFWVGFHKLIVDFIKPDGMAGFTSDIIPNDLAKFFPRDEFKWNTIDLGNAVGWMIGISEVLLAVLCFIPRARWLAAFMALGVHAVIIRWNCWQWGCNLIGFNAALGLAGLALIWPWKEWPWVSWKKCNWPIRIATILLLLYPATFYFGGACGYLSYCVYVPNTPFGMLYRPGEDPKFVPMLPVQEINFPLPPGHDFSEQWFDKIRKPGDVLLIHDPRPWAEARGLNGRQLTDHGDFPRGKHWVYRYEKEGGKASEGDTDDGKKRGLWLAWHPNGKLASQGVMINDFEQGRWMRWHDNGNKASEGNYEEGFEEGPWTFWYPDGRKESEGSYVNGQFDGVWRSWSPEGVEQHDVFRNGQLLPPEAAP